MFDREIEKHVRFWQVEKNCIILISNIDGKTMMDVLHVADGRIDKGVVLGDMSDNKEKIMVNISKHFKGVA